MGHSHTQPRFCLKAYARSHPSGYGQPSPPLLIPAKLQPDPASRFRHDGKPCPLATIDLADGSWQGPPASKHGEVAKRLGNGLQNRYTPVRIRSSPPKK